MVLRGSQDKDSDAERRFTDEKRSIDTVIGAGVRVDGKLSGKTNIDISGEFEGEIDISGLVWLRPGGKIIANLNATDVVLEGKASGKFIAAHKIDLRASAHVDGEMTSQAIAMAEGSFFEGSITMAGGVGEAGVIRYEEKRTPAAASNTVKKPNS